MLMTEHAATCIDQANEPAYRRLDPVVKRDIVLRKGVGRAPLEPTKRPDCAEQTPPVARCDGSLVRTVRRQKLL